MQFISRVFGAAPKASRVRQADRSPRSRSSQIGVESLEGRDLASNIPGVTQYGGVLQITATQVSNNTAIVSTDQSGNVNVYLNGNSQQFPAGSLWTVCYSGGQGGGDSFTNNTNLSESAVGNGGNNHFVGGSTWNTVTLWGSNNSYDARGGPSQVYSYNSYNNQVTPYSNVSVYQSSLIVWW